MGKRRNSIVTDRREEITKITLYDQTSVYDPPRNVLVISVFSSRSFLRYYYISSGSLKCRPRHSRPSDSLSLAAPFFRCQNLQFFHLNGFSFPLKKISEPNEIRSTLRQLDQKDAYVTEETPRREEITKITLYDQTCVRSEELTSFWLSLLF